MGSNIPTGIRRKEALNFWAKRLASNTHDEVDMEAEGFSNTFIKEAKRLAETLPIVSAIESKRLVGILPQGSKRIFCR